MTPAGAIRGATGLVAALSLGAATGASGAGSPAPARAAAEVAGVFCSAQADVTPPEPSRFLRPPPDVETDYFAIDLVTTKRLPGTARASGTGDVHFAPSPFGIALAEDGSYRYDVNLRVTGMDAPDRGVLVAWITTPEVDRIERLGALDADLSARGRVSWNKFLVVVTLEAKDDPSATTWLGPIVLRGVSRSGLMHTMAGHGPFQQELCAKYGYR